MLELLPGFPDNVSACACHGRVTESDYAVVLADIEDRLERHDKLRMYCEIGSDYAGSGTDSVLQDWKSSFSTWFHWERGAIVTDVDWMIWATKFFGMLVPGEWRAYPMTQAAEARRWVTGH